MEKNFKHQKGVKKRMVRCGLWVISVMVWGVMMVVGGRHEASAMECPDLRIVFARGSGSERYTNGHYVAFKKALEEKLEMTGLSYEFDDLDYPAVSIGITDGHLGTLLGAYIGGGDAYEFGDSVHQGTKNLVGMIRDGECKETKYVLAGYSQGAIVVLNVLDEVEPSSIVYAATFGDPKIYLPEGAGPVADACEGKNLSSYRMYVPDCRAYKGLLGARKPYVEEKYEGKVGTWCNKYDILCSSHFSIQSHVSYVEDGRYEDASRYILSKIGAEFGISNKYTSPHDTAILIDSTASMQPLIEDYKAEAMRLAEKSLSTGGRVALFDYGDLGDGYDMVERCNFETCTMEKFAAELDKIKACGGGDEPESLLSASFQAMKQLEWKFGSTKSLVILTDAGYHSPDLDGTTFYDVKKLSQQIDPVNFYIITSKEEEYKTLAEATDGAVVSSVDDLGVLTDVIMGRFDSLPRVEEEYEDEYYDNDLPEIVIAGVEEVGEGEVRVDFMNSGSAAVVILNDAIMGVTYEKSITIAGLRQEVRNELMLVPLSENRRGEGVMVKLGDGNGNDDEFGGSVSERREMIIPRAPDTGRR